MLTRTSDVYYTRKRLLAEIERLELALKESERSDREATIHNGALMSHNVTLFDDNKKFLKEIVELKDQCRSQEQLLSELKKSVDIKNFYIKELETRVRKDKETIEELQKRCDSLVQEYVKIDETKI